MKASLDLIKKLRSQLPPEAAEQLDELESLAGSEGGEESDSAMPNMFPEEGDDELMLEGHEGDGGGMEGLQDTLDEDAPPAAEEDEEEGTDEPVQVDAVAKSKKKAKKPSFWG